MPRVTSWVLGCGGLLAVAAVGCGSAPQEPRASADFDATQLTVLGTLHVETSDEGTFSWYEPTAEGLEAARRGGVRIEELSGLVRSSGGVRGQPATPNQIEMRTCTATAPTCDTPYGAGSWILTTNLDDSDPGCGVLPEGRISCLVASVELRSFLGRDVTNLYLRLFDFKMGNSTPTPGAPIDMVIYNGAQPTLGVAPDTIAGEFYRYGTLEPGPATQNLLDPPHQASVRQWAIAYPVGQNHSAITYSIQFLGTIASVGSPGPYQPSVTSVGNGTTEDVTAGCTSSNSHYTVLASADPLLPGHPAGTTQIYRVRRLTGAVDLVSRTPSGGFSNGHALNPCITPDGEHVVFESEAADLTAAADTNGVSDVFVRDMTASGATERVSVRGAVQASGCGRGGGSSHAAISDDGRYVAFSSTCASLCGGNDQATGCFIGRRQVYRFDRTTDTLIGVSVRSGTSGTIDGSTRWGGAGAAFSAGTHNSHFGWMSADGSRIVFSSTASAVGYLAPSDADTAIRDVFVRIVDASTTTRLSDNGGGAIGSRNPHISADGNFVVFETASTGIVAGVTDDNGATDIVRCSTAGGSCVLVSGTSATQVANGASRRPWLSADGARVAFESDATNLVSGDANGTTDVFVWAAGSGALALRSRNAQGGLGDGPSTRPRFDSTGTYLLYQSEANNIEADTAGNFDDDGGASDVFVIRLP